MKLLRKVGVTSEIWQIFIRDSSSTTGAGLTGLVFNTASLTAYYHRDTDTTATAITLVTMTVGTFTSSGFKEIDATNMPGWYQFCPPNAALATGAKSCMFHIKGASNMAPLPIEVDLQGDVNLTHWLGTAASTPATAGIPEVNAKAINNVSTSPVTTIGANIGTTQPVNFTGTGASAYAKSDLQMWIGVAPLALSSQQVQAIVPDTQKVDVNTVKTRAVTAAGAVVVGGFVGQDTAAIGVNASGHVSQVVLVDTLTTYTSNTPQTGDVYAQTNSGTFGLAAIKGYVDDIGIAGAGLTALGDTRIANLDAAISTRMATYTQPTGFLATTFPSGTVASSAEVVAIQNNTRVVRVVPDVIERPDSGTATYRVELLLYDDVGNMEAPDSAPTIALVNQSGTDRSSRLDSTTMALVSTGRYRAIYTADVGDALEQLVWTFSVVEGSATRLYGNNSIVVDTSAVDFTAADRVKLDTLHDTRIPGVIQPQTGDSFARIGATGSGLTSLAPSATALSTVNWTTTRAGYLDNINNAALQTTLAQSGDTYARIGSPAGASLAVDVAAVKTDTGNLVTRITASLFTGITSLAQWLGLIAGKQVGNTTARIEVRATGAGSGTYDETTDSQEAIRDRGDASWITATGFSTHTAADVGAVVTADHGAGSYIRNTEPDNVSAAAVNARLPSSPAAIGSAMVLTSGERDSIAIALLDLANGIETGLTLRQDLRLMAAVLFGKSSNGAATYRDFADSKNRIVSTLDVDGNRTAVTRDAT